MMTRSLILALAFTVGSAPALAATDADTAATTVRTDDLDLATSTGREALHTRIGKAAVRVCRSDRRGAAGRAIEAQCIAGAVAEAEPKAERAIAQARGESRLALLMIRAAR